MATTIINPAPATNTTTNNGMGFLLGTIIIIAFGFIFFIYIFPFIKQGLSGLGGGTVQINLPKTVDVNVQQTK